MLSLVEYTWIEGVLNHSLHGVVMLELGLREDPTAVHRPWDVQLRIPGQADHLLPPDTRLLDLFDQTGGTLLVLGVPGSGKTTLLLDLARIVEGVRAEIESLRA